MSDRSNYVRSLAEAGRAFESELGSVTQVDVGTLPVLSGLSLKHITLATGALREPQWNVDANQIAYVLSGRILVSMLGNADEFSCFVVDAGQMYHVESGAIYHIENIGEGEAEIVAALRSERPRHFSLQSSFNAMTDAVLGNTYDLPATAFRAFGRGDPSQIVRRTGPPVIPETAGLPNAHLFDVEGQVAPLQYPYGSARLARSQFWAALDDLSMYSLRVRDTGMREPHWHPVTAEMGYVHQGHARMSVLAPDGRAETYLLEPRQVYFIPRAYPHHIENVGQEELHFLIFFDQPTPGDIGYRATTSAFSRRVLSATFGVPENDLPSFPFTPVDPLIVPRRNPVDPQDGGATTAV